MIEDNATSFQRPHRLRRVLWFLAYALLTILALASLGALLPSIPVLGSMGPLLVSPLGPWIVIVAAAGAVLCARRWHRVRRRRALIVTIIAGFAAIGSAVVGMRQIAVARAAGISISLNQALFGTGSDHRSAPPESGRYGSHDGEVLPVVIYRPAPLPNGAGAPILVYVHGGGWGGGTVQDRADDMRFFADRGYLVVSVGYTLSTATRHTWDVAEPQVGCALIRVAANAERLGGDPGRVALIGESAGGNLVVNVSYKAAAGTLHPACAGTLPRIAATIAPYPVLDPVRMFHNGDVIAGLFAPTMTTQYTGGTPNQFPARYAAVSSFAQIHRAAPPTLLFPGLADHLLPPDVAFAFARQAQAAGIEVRVIAVPHAEHSFDQGDGSIGNQIVRNATLQFLGRHGMAPTVPQSR